MTELSWPPRGPAEPHQIDLVEDWEDLSFDERIEALKCTVTVPEVAQIFQYDTDEGDKIPSPWNREERTPSCHLYDDHFYDYSTGHYGDIFDLAIALNPELTLGQAVHQLKTRAVKVGKEYGDVDVAEPRALLDFSAELEPYEPVDFFGPIPVGAFGVVEDHAGNLYVPHREPERVYGVKIRWASGGKGSWAGSQYSHRLYDPMGWEFGPTCETAVIAEGESDAWALSGVVGFGQNTDVYALPSGVGTWRDHWLDDLQPYDRVLICMDNDQAGQRCRDKLMSKVGWARAEELKVPALYDDARAAIAAGWRPEAR